MRLPPSSHPSKNRKSFVGRSASATCFFAVARWSSNSLITWLARSVRPVALPIMLNTSCMFPIGSFGFAPSVAITGTPRFSSFAMVSSSALNASTTMRSGFAA